MSGHDHHLDPHHLPSAHESEQPVGPANPYAVWGFFLGALVTLLILSAILAILISTGAMTPVFLWLVGALHHLGIATTVGVLQMIFMIGMPSLGLLESLLAFFLQKPLLNLHGLSWPPQHVGLVASNGFWQSFFKGFLSALDGFAFCSALLFQALHVGLDLLVTGVILMPRYFFVEWLPKKVSACFWAEEKDFLPRDQVGEILSHEIADLDLQLKVIEEMERGDPEQKNEMESKKEAITKTRKEFSEILGKHNHDLKKKSDWMASDRQAAWDACNKREVMFHVWGRLSGDIHQVDVQLNLMQPIEESEQKNPENDHVKKAKKQKEFLLFQLRGHKKSIIEHETNRVKLKK